MGTDNLELGYLPALTDDVRAMLAPAIARGDHTTSEIEAELSAGTMQLVAIQTKGGDPKICAAGVIRSAITPRGEMLEIVLTGGKDMFAWATFGLEALRKAARDSGMTGVRIAGRPGWARVFREAGMKTHYVLLEMPV